MTEFRMPSLGADMDAGTLYEWFVKPGAAVKRGDVIASVETDKGVIDIECFDEGTLIELLAPPGTRVPVGQTIAVLRTAGEAAAVSAPQLIVPETKPVRPDKSIELQPFGAIESMGRPSVSPAARKLAADLGVDLNTVAGTGASGAIHLDDVRLAAAQQNAPVEAPADRKPHVTPVARRLAAERGIELQGVSGTGPHGAISRVDVERAAAGRTEAPTGERPPDLAVAASPGPDKIDFATAMRRAIALAMAKANREIPHYYLETRIDMTRPLAWLEAENAKRSIADRVLPVVLLIKATAKALVEVPEMNGYWRDDRFEAAEAIHIGFAIALRQGGLVTPAIHDADARSLEEIMSAMRDLITRTRGGRLRSSELTDATITLTSLGDTGVEKVFGVIYPPQVALVGFGKIMEQPWAENGMLGVRPILSATLAGDHRASDGRRGAQFLSALDKHLQEPETL